MAVTITDISKTAGVSLATVSRVINNSGYVSKSTREKVEKAIKELNFTPNSILRNLSKKDTNTVAVIVPDITNPYFGEIIKGISDVVEEEDLNLILFNTDNNKKKEMKSISLLKEQKIRGVIMTPSFGEDGFNTEYINTLENIDVPLVLVAANVKYAKLNGIFVDNIKGAYEATNLLIKEGHRKIGIITGEINSEPAMDRLIGYKKALVSNNITLKDEYIYYGDYKSNTSYLITKEILKNSDKPTALLICSNMMTIGCIRALIDEEKIIPKDMAIISFDKTELLQSLGLKISYVDDSPSELGQGAMKILLDIMGSKETNKIKEITISPTVILKGSEKLIK
ncbi:MAG: LacI family DNA-binding transcriptional regulator [Clostridiaceae bacterium]